jgi:hypothetical protein
MTLQERARNARKTLFSRYDQLNALWLQAEEQLTQLHIPRPVSHKYAEYQDWDQPNGAITSKYLGLQKVKGKWRICHGICEEWCQPEPYWTPIIECSAESRVEATKHLDGLRKAVVESAERFIPKVDEAINALAETLGLPASAQSQDLLAERAKLNGHRNK